MSNTISQPVPVSPSIRSACTDMVKKVLPGLGLTCGIAIGATLLQRISGVSALSPLMLAMVMGIAVKNGIGVDARAVPGIKVSLRRILRFAIILLGFQLTLEQLGAVGLMGFTSVMVTLVATFVFIKQVGRWLGVERKLTELIAAGTSVCGASAVVATNAVTRGSDEDVAYAIACVTVFGSLSLLLFPYLGQWFDMGNTQYGLWVGASVHEVAQVTGAAFQAGQEAGQMGTVAKLTRVVLLAPLVLTLGMMATRRHDAAGKAKPPMPWFVFGFLGAVLLNSAVPISDHVIDVIVPSTTFFLTIALAAMGLETDIGKLWAKGLRPLALGAIGWVFISALAFVLVQ